VNISRNVASIMSEQWFNSKRLGEFLCTQLTFSTIHFHSTKNAACVLNIDRILSAKHL